MKKEDLLKILYGDIKHIDHVNHDDIALYETLVAVTPEIVKNRLVDFLSGKITAGEMTQWAFFICSRPEYVAPLCIDEYGKRNREVLNYPMPIFTYYEDMFYVIQKLSTPELDGEVNQETVKQYLTELDKYFLKDGLHQTQFKRVVSHFSAQYFQS